MSVEPRKIRMIDADALIMHLNDFAMQESYSRDLKSTYTYRAIQECIKAVEEQPVICEIGVDLENKQESIESKRMREREEFFRDI